MQPNGPVTHIYYFSQVGIGANSRQPVRMMHFDGDRMRPVTINGGNEVEHVNLAQLVRDISHVMEGHRKGGTRTINFNKKVTAEEVGFYKSEERLAWGYDSSVSEHIVSYGARTKKC